jgi:hypothetical protein
MKLEEVLKRVEALEKSLSDLRVKTAKAVLTFKENFESHDFILDELIDRVSTMEESHEEE